MVPPPSSDTGDRDVKSALFDAALDAIIERGPGKLSLREVARRAGVSHAAPYNHFANKEALLIALAAEGYARLDRSMADAQTIAEPAPRAQLMAIGLGYLIFATRNPELYALMHDEELCPRPAVVQAIELAGTAQHRLSSCVRTIRAQHGLDGAEEHVQADCLVLWGLVHGLAHLVNNGLVDGVDGDDVALFRHLLERSITMYPAATS